ncbi:MAG: hypothetical protein HOC66_01545, partial [Flavobacteriales bacterium]|nr:hypothetical protein [Flavobacteriales bacterium]
SFTLIPSILIFSLSFCNNKQEKESNKNSVQQDQESNQQTIHQDGILYKLDMSAGNTEVNWIGYKTNEKTAVSGSFSEFSSDRENQSFNSIDDLVDGLNFSISSLSSSSGDPIRDLNLKDYFFKYLTDNFEIEGTLGRPINDSIDVSFNILGQDKTVRFAYSTYLTTSKYSNKIIQIKGKLNLVNQFNGEAFNSIHKQCFDLHKGSDGISKTWEEVDVHIKVLVINETNPKFHQ